MKLMLIELNELNFQMVQDYISAGFELPNFKQLFDEGVIGTTSEEEYSLLEPWIQWVSVHTVQEYADHKVFRLGDIVNFNHQQIFEKVEENGYSVGAVSPMNASNHLKNPAYFIPDPWTATKSDDSYCSRVISRAISQAVNDNAKAKLSFSSLLQLASATMLLVPPRRFTLLLPYVFGALRMKYRKAIFLDMLLHEFHMSLFKRTKADFSTVFFNAGAHLQHHYFHNSMVTQSRGVKNPKWYLKPGIDPIADVLQVYDRIIGEVLEMKGVEVIVSTALSQVAFPEAQFYYRLVDHSNFLNALGINYAKVTPRMTRDFLIEFDEKSKATIAEKFLSEIRVDDGKKLFGLIDNRGAELFVTLTYPGEVTGQAIELPDGRKMDMAPHVVFVAIKNGQHHGDGYAYFSKGIKSHAPADGSHVKAVGQAILNIYKMKKS